MPEPTRVRVVQYGGSQALLAITQRLHLMDIIDAVALKRDQGLSVGAYILLAVINRVLAPCSKAKLAEWFRHTALYHDVVVRDADLRSVRPAGRTLAPLRRKRARSWILYYIGIDERRRAK